MNKAKFGVIGAGHIGKRHAEMIMRNDEAELIAICDRRSKETCAVTWDVPFYATPEEMIEAHPEIEVISVCTPNGLHAEHALAALENKKHVVIEKPMALSKADCEKIIYTALNRSRFVFGVMQNRYSPPSQWIKELVDSGKLGEIFMVQINCFWNRDDNYYGKVHWKGTHDLDGGTLFTQFSHFIDIMYWLFGDIENIQARFKDFRHQHNTDFEDSGFISFDFVNEGIGSISFSTAVDQKNYESSMTIVAENGTVKIGGQYMNEVEYCLVRDYEMPELAESNPANDYGSYKGSAANHNYVIQNVIDALHGNKEITTNALEGLKVVDIIERIYASGERIVKVREESEESSVS
ncbi:MAG: Gfo/Idh/MocA family oxidoreductase [Flavobacteriales bacterium]|nr:Gfo/Idh/MocA family oxidoreductase [Flavobacteriales bacterium]MDG1781009.1 Gfo/Idh/MocA family oxidoreductase [Flavobacteriales bacterium]MDG2245369.1 Gfo/Idh/MocA family oxidoreductase [Flavobacteriales bacterium]